MANYHVWHHPGLEGAAPFEPIAQLIPSARYGHYVVKMFQSLRNDLAKLREDGVAKGIANPSIIDIGKSSQGRELWALQLGRGTEHFVLFTGCHHAREWISVEVPFLVAQYLVDTYTENPTNENERRVKHLLDNRKIWFVPMVNPDGHRWSWLADRRWRTNRMRYDYWQPITVQAEQFPEGRPPRTISIEGAHIGVDLNRNYPSSKWGKETLDSAGAIQTSRDPRIWEVWAGPSAGSEAETQCVMRLLADPRFRANISYHSYSQYLLFARTSRDNPMVQDVGKGMESLINASGNPYKFMCSDDMYPTTGDLVEYFDEVRHGRPNYTPELRPRSGDYNTFSLLPEDEIEPTFRENLPAALALINSAGFNAPAGEVRLTWTPSTDVAQIVRNCWRVFEEYTP